MLQSEYDAIVRQKRLKIFLIVLTAFMVVAVFLFVQKQLMMGEPPLMVNEPPKPTEQVFNPVVVKQEHFELQGAELEEFLKSDTPEARALRASIEFQSSQE